MIAYGVGQLGESLRTVGYTTFLLFYYNQILGLSGALTSLALSVSLIVDAVSDPIVGALSDRTRTRIGRRHPFMIAGMLPLGLLFFATFNPPALSAQGYFLWLLMSATLTRLAISLYQGPHLALGAEMARDYAQRSTLYSINMAFTFLAVYGAQALSLRAFFPTSAQFDPGLLNPAGYRSFSLAFAVAMTLALVIAIVGTWWEIPRLPRVQSRFPFSLRRTFVDVRDAFRNASFRALFFGMIFTMSTLAAESVLKPYMDLYFWGLTTEQMSWRPLSIMSGVLLALLLMPIVTRRYDKRQTLILTGLVSVVAMHFAVLLRIVAPDWFPPNGSPAILPILLGQDFIMGLSSILTYGSVFSMIADISDEHELEVGERREGVLFASRTFAQQIVQSLGIAMGGVLLDLIAFPRGARAGSIDAATLWHLGLIPLAAAALYLIGLACYSNYRIHRGRHAIIVCELEHRRGAGQIPRVPQL